MKYNNLFRPLTIGKLQVKNRIVMPAMNTNFADPSGHVNQRVIDYYSARAHGGVGMIIASAAFVDERAKRRSGNLAIYDDAFIEGLRALAKEVKSKGAVVFQQLNHVGRLVKSMTIPGFNVQPMGPSAIPHIITGEMCKELTVNEIKGIAGMFGQAAGRVKKAGFDGVEIHGAHGYLLNQFLSPYTNKRKDGYGGTLSGRMRFPLDVIEEVRRNVGSDFPISYRLSAQEYVNGGLELEDVKLFSRELQKAGVNILHISAGGSEAPSTVEHMIPPMSFPSGCNVSLAAEIKEIVNIPVIVAGKINTPELAEEILAKQRSDMIAMGRALIADPELPKKAQTGTENQIRRCVYCNQGCMERLIQEMDITCTVNPMVGKEGKCEIKPSKTSKKIFVIGGGPSGLEAARITGIRGHKVTLFDRGDKIGGQVLIASVPPGKQELSYMLDFYQTELQRLQINTILKTEIKASDVDREKPDVVIVATGSKPMEVACSGRSDISILDASTALTTSLRMKDEIAIIGGGQVGLEVATFLANKGHKVKIIEMLEDIGGDVGPLNRFHLREELRTLGVTIICSTRFLGLGENNSIEVESQGITRTIYNIETIVVAIGSLPDDSLTEDLKRIGFRGEIVNVGDCVKAGKILDAVAQGFEKGLEI